MSNTIPFKDLPAEVQDKIRKEHAAMFPTPDEPGLSGVGMNADLAAIQILQSATTLRGLVARFKDKQVTDTGKQVWTLVVRELQVALHHAEEAAK